MDFRRILALAAALACALPGASAQSAFDPLALDLPGWLGPGGSIVPSAPPAGAVDFPASSPAAPGAPLFFSFVAPLPFSAPRGADVFLHLVESKPFVAQDASKMSLRLSLLVDGAPAGNATSVAFAQPLAAPGGAEDVRATLALPPLVKGANVTLRLESLAPVLPEGGLSVALGPSTFSVPGARVPNVSDLELQDSPLQQFVIANGSFTTTERNAAVYTVHVKHAGIDIESKRDPTQTVSRIYVVLLGEESAADAAAHQTPDRARRIAAAHAFLVDGQLVRAHPGVGVVVPLHWNGRNLTVPLECAANCPSGGFRQALSFAAIVPPSDAGDGANTLIPPPRDTSGIPTSQDAPPERHVLPAPWAALSVVAALLAARRR